MTNSKHNDAIIVTEAVSRHYDDGHVQALSDINLAIRRGEYVAVMGPSGSGKSTLLNVIGALDRPTAGEVFFEGQPLSKMRDPARLRARNIGYVFQSFLLIPTLTALENVQIPMFEGPLRASQRTNGLASSSSWSTCRTAATTRPHGSPSANGNAWPSREPWPMTRAPCWPTSQPATSTRTTRKKCWTSFRNSIKNAESPWSPSPTARKSLAGPTASSACAMAESSRILSLARPLGRRGASRERTRPATTPIAERKARPRWPPAAAERLRPRLAPRKEKLCISPTETPPQTGTRRHPQPPSCLRRESDCWR